ncbi:MAG: hypothetical protein KKF27_21320, partial [Gammaproteobacteria bacterium]|nr:hypothetical protein [Gammaproteobacteria bacterium]
TSAWARAWKAAAKDSWREERGGAFAGQKLAVAFSGAQQRIAELEAQVAEQEAQVKERDQLIAILEDKLSEWDVPSDNAHD